MTRCDPSHESSPVRTTVNWMATRLKVAKAERAAKSRAILGIRTPCHASAALTKSDLNLPLIKLLRLAAWESLASSAAPRKLLRIEALSRHGERGVKNL